MATTSIKRPALPTAFYEPSRLAAAAFLVYAPLLYAVPALTARWVWTWHASLPLRWACIAPLTVLAAYGINIMVVVGHEGTHLSLFRNKFVSCIIGFFYSAAAPSHLEMGFVMQHWEHHRYTNSPRDPDLRPVAHLTKWWQRLLLSRLIYDWHYAVQTLQEVVGRPYPSTHKMPFTPRQIRALCTLNVAFALAWLAFYGAVALHDPTMGILSIGLPMATIFVLSGAETYFNHAGLGAEPFRNARTRKSWVWTALYFGTNYHLEHHIYPGVPCYRLPRVHHLLRESGIYDRVPPAIEPSFLGAFRTLTYDYSGGSTDSQLNPFVSAAVAGPGE